MEGGYACGGGCAWMCAAFEEERDYWAWVCGDACGCKVEWGRAVLRCLFGVLVVERRAQRCHAACERSLVRLVTLGHVESGCTVVGGQWQCMLLWSVLLFVEGPVCQCRLLEGGPGAERQLELGKLCSDLWQIHHGDLWQVHHVWRR